MRVRTLTRKGPAAGNPPSQVRSRVTGRPLFGPLLSALLLLLWASVSRGAVQERPREIAPMPDAWSAAFQAIKNDRPPKQIVRNIHYVISNEDRPQAFHDPIAGLGGVALVAAGTVAAVGARGVQAPAANTQHVVLVTLDGSM